VAILLWEGGRRAERRGSALDCLAGIAAHARSANAAPVCGGRLI
jgi:hypothetical protein